ncbi:DUF5602 domain-containing protein [Rhodococcus sp. NPDC127528]|uniref:DUF5602 domain-containing protein n=1 Tax=unclassified Rhodococcus (in: high G+C Gram-positive bacteria) TaxID=192944 RepID=UPI0036274DDD
MRANPRSKAAAVTVAVCASLAFVTAGGVTDLGAAGIYYGPATHVGDGTARSYVILNEDGSPGGVGFRLTTAALDGLTDDSGEAMQPFPLTLPPEADKTVFEHLVLDWNPHGHGPDGVFTKPHFDMHFYMIDARAVSEITPMRLDYLVRASNLPPAQSMPQDYAPPPGPPLFNTVPEMGLHWTDGTENMTPGAYDFTQTFMAGSWDGAYTFMEPMMTREWLLTKPTLDRAVKQPQSYPKPGYYPTTYSVRYDDSTNEYVVELGGMQMKQAP